MIKFIIKGILKDRNRSLFPVLIVASGVFLTVLLNCWITGVMGDSIDLMAKFTTGHVKVVSKAYAEEEDQMPNDLALMDAGALMTSLKQDYTGLDWVQRIKFAGLIDVPDEKRETRSQGPAMGMAIDLFSPHSKETERLNIEKSIQRGKVPSKSGEILISENFSKKIHVNPGDEVTFSGSTMFGSMTFYNFIVSGTIKFGASGMDRGSFIVDISDARKALDMEDAASEILGYFKTDIYDDERAGEIAASFNAKHLTSTDEFAPVMKRLREDSAMGGLFEQLDMMSAFLIFIFVFALSIVLWNTGLLNGLRRYNEFGIRLAMGENKGHIYRSLIAEASVVGLIGSVIGTLIGLGISYLLQENGLDFGAYTQGASSSMMMPSVYRAVITPQAFYIGFIPGVCSMVLGNMLSGMGIYKRKTAQLFKELEV